LSLEIERKHLHPEFDELKSLFFPHHHPDDPVIFHRKKIMNARRPFEVLNNQDTRKRFDEKLLRIISITAC
jgi:hypothetical protein